MPEMDLMQETGLIFISKADISQSAPESFSAPPTPLPAGKAQQLPETPQRDRVRSEKVSDSSSICLS